MQDENILHGPSLSDLEFKNVTLGQLILNQLNIRGTWIAQVNKINHSFYRKVCLIYLLQILANNTTFFRLTLIQENLKLLKKF